MKNNKETFVSYPPNEHFAVAIALVLFVAVAAINILIFKEYLYPFHLARQEAQGFFLGIFRIFSFYGFCSIFLLSTSIVASNWGASKYFSKWENENYDTEIGSLIEEGKEAGEAGIDIKGLIRDEIEKEGYFSGVAYWKIKEILELSAKKIKSERLEAEKEAYLLKKYPLLFDEETTADKKAK